MFSNIVNFIVLWILCFCLIASIIGFVIGAPVLFLVNYERGETTGEVTRLLPDTHGLVEVKYSVAAVSYRRGFRPSGKENEIAERAYVHVYYWRRDPSIAFIAPPYEILEEEYPAWVITALAGATTTMLGLLALRLAAPFRRFTAILISPKAFSAAITTGVLGSLLLSSISRNLKLTTLVGG